MCFEKMEKEKQRLYLDYQMEGYNLEFSNIETGSRRFVSAGVTFKDLFTTLSGECKFGTSIENREPAYELHLTYRGKVTLDKAEVNLLEAVVNYHNHLVEKGKQNHGG